MEDSQLHTDLKNDWVSFENSSVEGARVYEDLFKIDPQYRPDVRCRFIEVDMHLFIQWAPFQQVKCYEVFVTRIGRVETITKRLEQDTTLTLPKSVYDWKFGEKLELSINAEIEDNMHVHLCQDKSYVIGGDKVASEVNLYLHEEYSYQSLRLQWCRPELRPDTYEIYVHKVGETAQDSKKIYSIEAKCNENEKVVDSLEQLTLYYCSIVAKFSDGSSGKEVESNTVKTDELPSDRFAAQQIMASLNPENPARQIIVKWKQPKKKVKISYYEVYLWNFTASKTVNKLKIESYMEREVVFSKLKSSTKYRACVVTHKANSVKFSKSTEEFSDALVTGSATKTPGFDIYLHGKPDIQTCQLTPAQIGYNFNLHWKLPEIGSERLNYDSDICAFYMEKGSKKHVSLKTSNNRFIETTHLQAGKSYIFTVTCKYYEYDNEKTHSVSDSREIITEIKSPMINSIYCGDKEEVIIEWEKADGAERHIIQLLDDKENSVHNKPVKFSPVKLEMRRSCRFGNTCTCIIEAHGKNEQMKFDKKKMLLGGDQVVTDVSTDIQGRREILVKWKRPKENPSKYKVEIYEMNDEVAKNKIDKVEHYQTSHIFKNLKCDTKYCCFVYPQYAGKFGKYTESGSVTTPRRIDNPVELQESFGKPETVLVAVEKDDGSHKIEIKWSTVYPGENFVVVQYNVKVVSVGRLYNSIRTQETNPDVPRIVVDIEAGQKYKIEITTSLKDLDTLKRKDIKYIHIYSPDPEKPVIDHFLWDNGVLSIGWRHVPGADLYRLILKDTMQYKQLESKTFVASEQKGIRFVGEVAMGKELRVGQAFTAKVIACIGNKEACESDWKSLFIGEDTSPRNVVAEQNPQDPIRSIDITFDRPNKGNADEYRIDAIPKDNKGQKQRLTNLNRYTFDYLRSSTQYHFEISSRWGDTWYAASQSSEIATNPIHRGGVPATQFIGNEHVTLEQNNSNIIQVAQAGVDNIDKDFGKIRNLKHHFREESETYDTLIITWDKPSFGNNDRDYRVEDYTIGLQMSSTEPKFVICARDKTQYRFTLTLGHRYSITIKTRFEIIDAVRIVMSEEEKMTVYSRPCKPSNLTKSPGIDEIKFEWNKADGAEHYDVLLYTNVSKTPYKYGNGSLTSFTKKFNEFFGYGVLYHAKVIAYGKDGRCNHEETDQELIGGEYVPTTVHASIDNEMVKDPSTQVYVSWTPSQILPKSYQLEVYRHNSLVFDVPRVEKTFYLFENLKAGTEYMFKVKAVHQDVGKERITGGCSSKKVETTATPTRVKNVALKCGPDPSTSISICWEEVIGEKKEIITYQVSLESQDSSIKREDVVVENKLLVTSLRPATNYKVEVRAGNADGYGRWSEACSIDTKLDKPRSVRLSKNEKKLSTSLHLKFDPPKMEYLYHVCNLFIENKEIGKSIHLSKSETSYTFDNLKPNHFYSVKICAVFDSDDSEVEGENVISDKIKTGPSKVIINEDSGINERNGCRQIYASWNREPGIDYYEVKFMRGQPIQVENIVYVGKECKVIYSCHYEAIEYSIEVRAHNEAGFGDPSERKIINLVPSKLHGVHTELQEDGKILVSCQPATTHSPSYYMLPICGDEKAAEKHIKSTDVTSQLVKWEYLPEHHAQKYTFYLWAQDNKGRKGEITRSNEVISKPAAPTIKVAKAVTDSITTDIEISWSELARCDRYELKICQIVRDENCVETFVRCVGTSTLYRCHSPGTTYEIVVRGVAGTTHGEWSQKKATITLVPGEVELLDDDVTEPLESLCFKWKALKVQPDGYKLELYRGTEFVLKRDVGYQMRQLSFSRQWVHPGLPYFCKVYAYNKEGCGRAVTSKKYVIAWELPKQPDVIVDEEYPHQRATIKWEQPSGTNCFELKIENNQTGHIISVRLKSKYHKFESGVPGHTYTVRLYCGYDNIFSKKFVQCQMVMRPVAPTQVMVTADKDATRLVVNFTDKPSFRKHYLIKFGCLTQGIDQSDTINTSKMHVILHGLNPGAMYSVEVVAVVGEVESPSASSVVNVETLPGFIQNLRPEEKDGRVLFVWDALDIPPKEYGVQWKINIGGVTDDRAVDNCYTVDFVKPATRYSFRVWAINSSGCGRISEWKTHITKPKPPHNPRISKIPGLQKPHFLVQFQDERDDLKTYKIRVHSQYKRDPHERTIDTQELSAVVDQLKPGTPYLVYVKTLFCGEESEEIIAKNL